MAPRTSAPTPESITHRRVVTIALPILISYITVPILGLVDTGVVGQLGRPEPIGGVGIGAVILTALYWVFGFLRMGITGMTAQALGQKERIEVAALLQRGLLIGIAAGVGLIALQVPLFRGGFALTPASEMVETLAGQYMRIRIWSAPAAIALYAITGWLIAQERTRAVLLIQLWMNGANIALDLLFVPGFGWGVQGVASATFIAEWSSLALGLWICRAGLRTHVGRARLLDRDRLRQMGLVNTDILIRSVLLQGIMVSFLLLGARFGDVQLAANQVLLQFVYVTGYALDGFAFAAETLVGQALGARNRALFRRAAAVTSIWAAGVAVALALAFALFGGWGIDLMTTAPGVRAMARDYLPFMVATPLIGCAAWMLDGIFIGATRTADMRNMMIVTALVYGAAVMPLMDVAGNTGLWIALLISFGARGITLGLRYPALERSVGGTAG